MNQFLSRRTFILIPTMSILKTFFKPMQVLASSLASKEEWNLSKEEWKSRLSPESYYILREEGTERAFSSELNNEKRKGVFHCAGCDLPLFLSQSAFSLKDGGYHSHSIPCEGYPLWNWSWAITRSIPFRVKTGYPFRLVQQHEHLNNFREIVCLVLLLQS